MDTVDTTIEEIRTRTRNVRPYPQDTLEEAVKIAKAIYDQNDGRPMDRLMLAKAILRTPASSAFRSLVTSSSKYGLIDGNYNAPRIELTALGEAIAGAKDKEEHDKALVEAAQKPEIFNKFYQALDQKKLPEDKFAENMLRREFGVVPELTQECFSVSKANAEFIGIITEISGVKYISLGNAVSPQRIGKQSSAMLSSDNADTPVIAEDSPFVDAKASQPVKPKEIRVFLSHSKNKRILEQVKTMLAFGKYEYEVAEEIETTAIPVPNKIQEAMKRCSAAIVIISADEKELQGSTERYGINQNVLIEIGAAFVLYDRIVVLVVDKRVDLPSNLQGLYRCDYQGDELSWDAGLKLQKAITEFRNGVTTS